jgi:hypothetical protein
MKGVILSVLFVLQLQGQDAIRSQIDKAYYCSKSCKSLLEQNLSEGHKAVLLTLSAKHHSNPFVKIKHFNQGKSLLEKIIRENPTKAEWIYYRFVIQSNTPSILNYKKNLNEDRIFLEKILQQNEIDSDLKNRIVIVLNQKPKERK